MKNGIKRLLATLLTVVTLLTAAPLSGFVGLKFPKIDFSGLFNLFASAEDVSYPITGICGANLTWSLSEDGILIIDGDGEMFDASFTSRWGSYNVVSIIVKDGVKSIGSCAFYKCKNVTNINIGSGVKKIGNYAFGFCERLESILFGENVEILENDIFYACYSLNYVYFSSSVKKIGSNIFESCHSLLNIEVSENNQYFKSVNGALLSKDGKTFIKYPIGKSANIYNVPFGVETIGAYAFDGGDTTSVKRIIIPDGVKTIRAFAFSRNDSIEEVCMPDTVTTLERVAFWASRNLKRVTLSSNINIIESEMFRGCNHLESITIPDGVVSIGYLAFEDCSSLHSVIFSGDSKLKTIGKSSFKGCSSLVDINIPSSVISIDNQAFMGCSSIERLSIPSGVKVISENTFADCSSLSYISLPTGLTTIVGGAFKNCSSLDNLVLPDSLMTINGSNTFCNCKSLTKIQIPNTVSELGSSMFSGCSSLIYCKLPNQIHTIPWNCFKGCKSLSSITIPPNITTIGYSAFNGCSSLISITIPQSVTSINGSAFAHCTLLSEISLPSTLIDISGNAFYNTAFYNDEKNWDEDGALYLHNYLLKFRDSNATSFEIKTGTRLIAGGAFGLLSNLVSIKIPSSVVSICQSAFSGCTSLEYLEHTCNDSSANGILGDYAFSNCTSLKAVKLGASITSIGDYAFQSCKKLQCVSFTNRVTSLYYRAFPLSNLTDIYYSGTYDQWSKIKVPDQSKTNITKLFTKQTIHYRKVFDFSLFGSIGNNDIIITPKDKDATSFMFNPTMSCGNKNVTLQSGKRFVIEKTDDITGGAVLSNTGHQNYIIPEEVLDSWRKADAEPTKNSSVPAYEHKAYMQAERYDDKPYISTIFGRSGDDGAYTELQTSSLKIYNGDTYSIIISAGNINTTFAEYFIEQDANHKISNLTGVFSDVDLFHNLDYGKKCYAYVKAQDGTISELVEIKLEKQAQGLGENMTAFFSGSTLDLLGKDYTKYTLPSNIPLLGDAELSLNAFKLPAGFMIDGDSIKISIGANIFDADKTYGKNWTKDYKKTMFKDWKDLTKTTISEAYNESVSDHTKARDRYKRAKQRFTNQWYNKAFINKCKNWDIDALGYMEVSMVNGEFITKEAMISVEGSFTFKYTQQGAIFGVPAYFTTEMGASLGFSSTASRLVADNDVPFELEASLKLEPNLKLECGLGIEDVVKVGVWGKATVPILFEFTKKHWSIDIVGKLGLDARLFVLDGEITLVDGTLHVVDAYWNSHSSKKIRQYNPITGKEEEYIIITNVQYRDYLEDTSGWFGNKGASVRKAKTLESEGMKLTPLQTSIFENAQPQIAKFGDKLLMTWVEDDASRDTYNRMRLMYSVYDGSVWSDPQPVMDNGYNDNAPQIKSDGTNVYFTWQKINKTLTAEDCTDVENLTRECEIYTATFNGTTGQIENARRMTNNSCFDYANTVSIINGEPTYYWVSCTDNNMSSGSANTLYKSTGETTSTVMENLNYVISVDAAFVNGKESITYVMDENGDTLSANDINAFTYSDGIVTAFDKGDNDVAYISAFYGDLNGKTRLFVSDLTNIYYIEDGEIKTVLNENARIGGNIQLLSGENSDVMMWTQMAETGNAVWSSSYENGEWTNPIKVSQDDKILASVNSVLYNNKVYGVCTSTSVNYDEGTETYSSGQTDLCSFTINEIQDVSVDSIMLNERDVIKGEEVPFEVYVTNNGTQTVEQMKFTVTDTLGYEKTVTVDVSMKSGEGKFVELPYTASDNYQKTTLTVLLECEEINDSNADNNSVSKEIGTPKIVLSESEIHVIDGVYVLSAIVTNDSEIDAENINVKVMLNSEENIKTVISIDSLPARNSKVVEITLSKEEVDFDNNGAGKVYFEIEDDANNDIVGDKICYLVEQYEAECLHSVTHEEHTASTCSIHGSNNVVCDGCGEVLSTEELPLVESLEVVIGSQTVIDNENKLIYGIDAGTNNLSGLISAKDGFEYTISNSDSHIGTGSEAVVTMDGTEAARFSIVLFGDVNGDGFYDGQDATLVNCIANGLLTREQVGEAKWMAADCNHDGEINSSDVLLLEQAGLLLANVDQTMSQDELMQSNSYMEYLNLIDQNPDADEEPIIEEPTEPDTAPQTFLVKLIEILQKVITFIRSLFPKI